MFSVLIGTFINVSISSSRFTKQKLTLSIIFSRIVSVISLVIGCCSSIIMFELSFTFSSSRDIFLIIFFLPLVFGATFSFIRGFYGAIGYYSSEDEEDSI